MWSIFHPQSSAQKEQRDILLTAALRPEGSPFPIAKEYPIVLGREDERLSFCLGAPNAPVAHANLWPRRLISRTHDTVLRIGLIGNVATTEQHRGQGLMRELFSALKTEATSQGLAALILWSDLLEFYQKLGFSSCGREHRWQFSRAKLRARLLQSVNFTPLASTKPAVTEALLKSRYPVDFTLERSPTEFAQLLQIPGLTALISAGYNPAYVLLGKGCDMTCVVHEWGAPTPAVLLAGVLAAAEAADLADILLLTPANLEPSWQRYLHAQADVVTEHSMALMWCNEATQQETFAINAAEAIDKSFIWGLDSI